MKEISANSSQAPLDHEGPELQLAGGWEIILEMFRLGFFLILYTFLTQLLLGPQYWLIRTHGLSLLSPPHVGTLAQGWSSCFSAVF